MDPNQGLGDGAYSSVRRQSEVADPASELTSLLDHYHQAVFNFLTVLLGNRDAARDCTQDTFLRAYENLRKGKPVNVYWLYRVARNRATDILRLNRREHLTVERLDESQPDSAGSWFQSDRVRDTLLKLSPADREVLYLAEVDGLTSLEIGRMLGIRPGTVRMRLTRAHVRFRTSYAEQS
jgi:RNA polymerase sigma factor (sigma-70 family)